MCSRHFREEDIDRTSLSCVRLRDNAIPKLHLGIPAKEEQKRRPIKRKSENNVELKTSNHGNEDCPETPRKKLLLSELKKTKESLSVYKNKVRNLSRAKRRLLKKIVSLEEICKDLRNKKNFTDESCELLRSISKTSECLMKRSYCKIKNPQLKNEFDERLRAFSITLHFLSPKAYSYVRKTFDSALPHPRTLSRWYSSVKGDPGFSEEVLIALKDYSSKAERPPICALIIDGMAIKKHLQWDGKRFHGTVNVGSAIDDDSAILATEALVFHLVFVNSSWKIPVGYFFIAGLNSEQITGLVKQCLTLIHDTGVTVASLTCDGTSCHISMANKLGCSLNPENLLTTFPHPLTKMPVHFFFDPSHMLKLVRNTIGEYKVLIDKDNNSIEWKYIEMLHEIQVKEELRLGNRLTKDHIQYHKQKMKVKLAAQVLSNSVADSLQYLNVNHVKGFESCQPTIQFLKIFNNLFDVLNSRNITNKGTKKALCPGMIDMQSKILTDAKDYITNLKDKSGEQILKSRRRTGFLGFLVCIQSALSMYREYVQDSSKGPLLKYLPLYKISQDHLERLFGYIRSRGGYNNNPTCKQFTGTFKRLLLHSELHEGNTGNTVVLDKSMMFNLNRGRSAIEDINSSMPQWRRLSEEEKQCFLSEDKEDESNVTVVTDYTIHSDLACDIVEYIGGYVARKIKSKLMCIECINLLFSKDVSPKGLIFCKNRGGLLQPSSDLYKLCKISESILRVHIKSDKCLKNVELLKQMTLSVMKACVGLHLFSCDHFLDHDVEQNHIVLLVKSICEEYFKVRLHYFAKNFNEKIHFSKVRNNLNKTVLFLGQ